MFNGNLELTGETLNIVEQIGSHMPGGFFIYEARQPEKLIYANKFVFDIFGCKDLDEFRKLTGYTFKGMLHPDDYAEISDSIVEQININDDNMDYVEYRIIRKDGTVRWVDDYGHYAETKEHGGVYYVFISDITEKKERRENEARLKEAEAEARIRQRELEEKVALQEKLLSQSETLREALKTAEDANKAKSNFLSNMSHEIRTPIMAILGMNELIRRECTDETILGYSSNINKAGNSLLGIINDILDFSKIEAGRMELSVADYDLKDTIRDICNMIRFRIEDKGLLFRTEIDDKLPSLLNGDELKLKQIMTNLLSNAAKYTEKGTVSLIIRGQKKTGDSVDIYVAVKDTGIGIRDDEKSMLFSAFDRLDTSHNRGIEGTGLGLAITYKMLNIMGSELKVDSTYGKGSVFSFVLRQRIVKNMEIGDFDPTAIIASHHDYDNVKAAFTAPDARILIVDDTPLNLQVIVGLLKHTKVKLDTATSGSECIKAFGKNDYDMVFLDYRMPELDGIETLREMSLIFPEKIMRTPVISLTASAVSGDREKMLLAGFDDYLPKPVNTSDMEQMMIKYLPKNKVILTEASEDEDELSKLPASVFEIKELDPRAGIEYCGDAEDYMNALKVYFSSVTKKAEEIEQTLKNGDLEKYTIMIHSLKSTSRAVGALDISELSLALENGGKKSNIELINKYTPELLQRYRALKTRLETVFEDE